MKNAPPKRVRTYTAADDYQRRVLLLLDLGARKFCPNVKPMCLCRRTAEEIASALCYLHKKDIIHADLCGGNVLLCSDIRDERGFMCKIADFGLARCLAGKPFVTTSTYGTVSHAYHACGLSLSDAQKAKA